MNKMEPKAEEIVKALKCCFVDIAGEGRQCEGCYLRRFSTDGYMSTGHPCFEHLALDTIAMIRRMNDTSCAPQAVTKDTDSKAKCHLLKLKIDFCDAVFNGEKLFEIRENDRGFQRGDFVRFEPYDPYNIPHHPIENKKYVITYVLNGWGLKYGFVAFGIKELEENSNG